MSDVGHQTLAVPVDLERIFPQQELGCVRVDVPLRGPRPVEGLTQTYDPLVSVHMHPQEVGKTSMRDGLDRSNFHF